MIVLIIKPRNQLDFGDGRVQTLDHLFDNKSFYQLSLLELI